MNTRQMRQFLEIYKQASFNKASYSLYISRTALQASIDSLEKELGQALFIRSANGIALTDFGHKFLGVARQILALCDGLLPNDQPDADHLTVSSSHLQFIARLFLDQFMYLKDNAHHFRFNQTTRKQICQDVIDGTSDLGIIALPSYYQNIKERFLKENGIDFYKICSVQNCCLVGPNSPLYSKQEDHISLYELSEYVRVLYDEPQLTAITDVNLQPPAMPSPSPYPCTGKLHINDSGSCYNILSQTDCYYIGYLFNPTTNDLNVQPGIRCLELADYSVSYNIIWIKRNDRVLSSVMKQFLRSIYIAVGKHPHDILL